MLKPVISFDTLLSYKPVQDLSTRVAVDCHCDSTRLTFMFQILKLIVDTAMVSANSADSNTCYLLQETVTLIINKLLVNAEMESAEKEYMPKLVQKVDASKKFQ